MSRSVYIETSVVSYLTGRPSQDAIVAACRQITRSWWDTGRAMVVSYILPELVTPFELMETLQ